MGGGGLKVAQKNHHIIFERSQMRKRVPVVRRVVENDLSQMVKKGFPKSTSCQAMKLTFTTHMKNKTCLNFRFTTIFWFILDDVTYVKCKISSETI